MDMNKSISLVLLVLVATTLAAATSAMAKKSPEYKAGFSKGVSDANQAQLLDLSVQTTLTVETTKTQEQIMQTFVQDIHTVMQMQ
jgi:TolA-binding protein